MARSSKQDILEKFRFEVSVIEFDFSIQAGIEGIANIPAVNNALSQTLGTNPFTVLSRSGFSEIVLPRADVNVISYRENLDNTRFSKSPGLTKYEPITLKRGVSLKPTSNSSSGATSAVLGGVNLDLYNWYQMVNNDTLLLNIATELGVTAASIPSCDDNFRREVLINVMGRDGTALKQYMLFNAFPIGYKGGNDLNAQADEKLIEEITLAYEFFLEFEGGLAGLAKELAKSALNTGAAALTGGLIT